MNYAALVATVRRLIDGTGRVVTFETLSGTPADAARPWRGPAAPTVASSAQQRATFVPAAGTDFGKDWMKDDLLQRCQQVCLTYPATGYDINDCTSIADGGLRWRVDWVQVLKPADTELLFAVGVSR